MINSLSSVLCSRYVAECFYTLCTECINSNLLHIRNQICLSSIFDWRSTVQKIGFLRYPQRLINPQLIPNGGLCPTIVSCITGHIRHFRDFFTGLYGKKSWYFFLFSFITFLEPFIISIRLCTFCLGFASGIFYRKKYKTRSANPFRPISYWIGWWEPVNWFELEWPWNDSFLLVLLSKLPTSFILFPCLSFWCFIISFLELCVTRGSMLRKSFLCTLPHPTLFVYCVLFS